MSIVVDKNIEYDTISNIVKKQAGAILESIELFDIYIFDKAIEEYKNKKSISISMVFRDSRRKYYNKNNGQYLKRIRKNRSYKEVVEYGIINRRTSVI